MGREIALRPHACCITAYAVRGLDINTSYTIYRLLNEQKAKGVAVHATWARTWTCCWSCATAFWCCAAVEITGIVDGRTATKEEVGLLMTKTGEGARYLMAAEMKTQEQKEPLVRHGSDGRR